MNTTMSRGILKSKPLTNSVRIILAGTKLQLVDGRPLLTVAAFLQSATDYNVDPTSSAVLQPLFGGEARSKQFGGSSDDGLLSYPDPEDEFSPGLWQAFEEALEIRGQAGGKDMFVSLRHVIFAIFTSRVPPLSNDTADHFRQLGVNRETAIRAIVDFCLTSREPDEKLGAWTQIFESRGIKIEQSPPAAASGSPEDSGTKSFNITIRPPEVALLQADDPWHGKANDRTGAGPEAEAFAAMICASEFMPPLAVGIFGEWGAGKSFFMRLVYEAIIRRTSNAVQQVGKKPRETAGNVRFLNNVVQIRFNAWHYAETNLWASLVDHIFTCLDRWAETHNGASEAERLFEQLATARKLTVESAETLIRRRRERKQAADKLAEAEKDLKEKRNEVEADPKTWIDAAWKTLTKDGSQKKSLNEAAEILGLSGVTAGATELQSAVKELDDSLARHAVIKSATIRALAAARIVILITVGIIIIPPLLASISLRLNAAISPVAAAVSGAFAPIAVAFAWAAKKTRNAIGVVNEFGAKLEEERKNREKESEQNRANAEKDLTAAVSAVGEAEERLKIATDKVAEASRDYNIYTGKGRVLRFVRERVANRDYEKQLSFVATVRKDFQELSDLMAPVATPDGTEQARKLHREHVKRVLEEGNDLLEADERSKLELTIADPQTDAIVFERIVLYIDDLDRCPADKVVDVLQAVHLLLTFPLFVVFVAVDVRWLSQALHQTYPTQLKFGQRQRNATPGDYLEKIFQIPYWVRPMSLESTRAILADRMGPEEESVREEKPERETTPSRSGKGQQPKENRGKKGRKDAVGQPAELLKSAETAVGSTSLRLTSGERAYINDVAELLVHSPRRTLRFINTYRIMKASFDPSAVQQLENGGFKALLTLLALTVSGEEGTAETVLGLSNSEPSENLAEPQLSNPLLQLKLDKALSLLKRSQGAQQDLTYYARLVSRFSFEAPAN